ncbi:MAG: sensor histidine kinase [Steroidobacteraceae bacterium]
MKPAPPASGPRPPEPPGARDGAAASTDDSRQTLHGQMLHVSRLATVGEMAAGIAHELNQPLAAIANYAQACERLLGRPDTDPADLREALQEISAQAMRAGDILRRLRNLARNRPVQRAPADINAVITEIADLLQGDARAHRARLELDFAEQLPSVSIDAMQIQHVLLNLARNGFEAVAARSTGAPEVRIRTSLVEDGGVEVAVCDNGLGVSARALERLFDPFFSTKEEGTGLGLPISNTVIRAQGGTLGYRPNVPAGACFYFHLPAENPK